MLSKDARDRLEIRKAYKRIFESDDGRKVMADLEKQFGYNRPIYDDNPHKHACNEGARWAVLYIKQETDVDSLAERLNLNQG